MPTKIQSVSAQEAIIAQCTPKGSGAIALLRVSGPDALTIASRMSVLSSKATIDTVQSHTINVGWVVDEQGEHIDHVMFMVMHAPKTFTGEHVVEITCHNNPFIIESIVQTAIRCGARMAQEGEFTRQAYLNKKIDLLQAEAINELIHANTQQALKKSLAQLGGSLSYHITKLEEQLYAAFALSEASFEFLDDEIEFGPRIATILQAVMDEIATLKKNFDQQQHIRQGLRIALIGSVNAGKSSLFNALLGKDRAIVTNVAGTTRDVIEAGIYRDGSYWTLIDTAGLRETNDIIEQEGIRRSLHEACLADIILLIYDHSRLLEPREAATYATIIDQHADKIIVVHNKIDLPATHRLIAPYEITPVINVCAQKPETVAPLKQAICKKVEKLLHNSNAPFLLNQRQFNLVLGLENKIHSIMPMLHGTAQYEIVSYHLKEALEVFAELTGKSVSERCMDAIFKEFCVGK